MEDLAKALEDAKISITKYDPTKARPIFIAGSSPMSVESFGKLLVKKLGASMSKYPAVMAALFDHSALEEQVAQYATDKGLPGQESAQPVEVPKGFQNLTLNMDFAGNAFEDNYFMTTDQEIRSTITGRNYLKVMKIPEEVAINIARKVTTEYMPREKAGIKEKNFPGGETLDVFNTYIPAAWTTVKHKENLGVGLPVLFKKLVHHMFPIPEEREYFYSWVWYSLFKRAPVFLVLCGIPAVGKNTLRHVLNALHGDLNYVNGKKSAITGTFNSQLGACTLVWFDELKYDHDMENTMKEMPNNTLPMESKGVDTTRKTPVYGSYVISNNAPRDNYLAFNARKFVPLKLRDKPLGASMTKEEIDELVEKTADPSSETYDLNFIAQIATWIKKNGRSNKWPNLEYRGPMFYTLAHTSMTKWQKKSAELVIKTDPLKATRIAWDKEKGFLWSSLIDSLLKKHPDRSIHYPDYTTVRHFFEIFLDSNGDKPFKTEIVKGDIMSDFYVKKLFDTKIVTESEALADMGTEKKTKVKPEEKDEDYLDL